MAENTKESSPVSPVGIHVQEASFPSPYGNPSNNTSNTRVHSPASDSRGLDNAKEKERSADSLPTSTTLTDEFPGTRTPKPKIPHRGSADPRDARLPRLHKFSTDQPHLRLQPMNSFLGRSGADKGDRSVNLRRQPTLTFDPYLSDSTDSSDDEQVASAQTDGAPREQSAVKRKRYHAQGPFSRFKITHHAFDTKGKVSKADGRLKLKFSETLNSGYFAKTLGTGLKNHFRSGEDGERPSTGEKDVEGKKIAPEDDIMEDPARRVKLNIVIIVIGSRGDIQPFLRIGKILKEDYGHRVRIATHPAFAKFVAEDSGLEFFSIGGDPSELMAFMVKNPGLLPSMDTIKEGEIGRRRAGMFEMFQGMWRACINSTDDEDDHANLKMMGEKQPFVADAIIANPPSFAPPHIAERLGVPLHMMFTFPYTPTVQFPHPLANVQPSNIDPSYTNFMSYPLVEMMTWQGLGDLINRFRTKTLWLDEVSTLWAPGQLYRLKVPYTYMWSPGLVPKPKDWGPEIDISGFVFLDLASSFKPPEELVKFLNAGPPPIYIGFGSIVVDDPDKFTELIFQAVKLAGVRALVSKGWGGFGGKGNAPENVFMLENTPHDWLFPRVSAVVHHGGAGTTAIGLKCGKPTMIVPFFGDQPFWGGMVSKARAGAFECIPYKKLTAERLAEGIKQCLTDEARTNVQKIADSIAKEGDGALNAVRSFHRSLPLQGQHNMRCQILPNHCAAWSLKNTSLRLSPLAAELLVKWKKIKWNELRLLRHYEWNDFGGPGEPLTGLGGAVLTMLEDVFMGVGLVPFQMARSVQKRERYYAQRFKVKKRQQHAAKTLQNTKLELTNGDTQVEDNGHERKLKRQSSNLSRVSTPDDWLVEEFAQEAGIGLKKTGGAIIKSPMYFTLAIAQGFHNAPRLYGDETVRRPPRITGFHSGVRAGRDEFMYGIYDGFTGIWRQPIHGAKDGGMLGCFRGFGMGIGGLVLKDIAALVGPPAYFMKGLDEESMKKHQPTNFLRRARIAQGQSELRELNVSASRKDARLRRTETHDGRGPTDWGTNDTNSKLHQVERDASQMWRALRGQIEKERSVNRSGIKCIMPGYKKGNEGIDIPRKNATSRPSAEGRDKTSAEPKKAISSPIKEAEWAQEGADAPERGIKSTRTAPGTAMEFKEKMKKKNKFEGLTEVERDEARTEGIRKQGVPNSFMSGGVPVNRVQTVS